jgi:hypothetical protein
MKNGNVRFCRLDGEAVASVVREWQAAFPAMGVLALLPEAEAGRLPLLQSACRAHGVPLVGGIFPALVTPDGFAREGVWLLRFDTMVPYFLLADVGSDHAATANLIADRTAAALPAHTSASGRPTLYLIFDALIQNTASMLEELYLRLADQVDYAGVAGGSETFERMPCVFDGERVVDHGVLGLLLPSNVTTVLEHGFAAPAKVMTATATSGNRIISIDWRPALDVYREIVRRECGIELTPANFYEHAVRFPFGILRANSEVIVRIPVAMTDDGCVYCIGEVSENAILFVLRAPVEDRDYCAMRLATRLQGTDGPLESALLVFYCAGRRLQMGDDAIVELRKLAAAAGSESIAGALSLGEIGSTNDGGYPLFHNATLVSTPWRQA